MFRKKPKPSLKEGFTYPREDCPQCGSVEFTSLIREIYLCKGCNLKVRLTGDGVIGVV